MIFAGASTAAARLIAANISASLRAVLITTLSNPAYTSPTVLVKGPGTRYRACVSLESETKGQTREK